MPIKTLKRPFVASGSPVLLLLLFVVVSMVQHAGAATTSAGAGATTSSEVCDAEAEACSDDPECSQCRQSWVFAEGGADALDECKQEAGWDSADFCTWHSLTPCCQASFSANGEACLVNSAYVDYWNCYIFWFSEEECSTFSCDGSGVDINATSGVGSSSPRGVLAVLGLGFRAAALAVPVLL